MADSDIFVSNDIELDVDFGEIYVIDQGVVTKVVAKKYDPTKTYVVGEFVIHLEKLYKCVTVIEEPEEFDSEKWTQVLLADEVQILNATMPTKADKADTYTKSQVDTALGAKADKSDTYTKQEVDTAVGAKADKSDTYTKQDVNDALALKADKSDTYTKGDVNGYLDLKADKSDTYTKQEVDTAVGAKADSDDVYAKSQTYSKTEVDNIISNLPAPMIFKGTLGTGGTITTLPTASSSNEGYTYKVITDGTYASQAAKAGDMFTSNGSEWIYIPSGDETFTDTWRGIKVNGTEKLTSAISSGEVDFINGTNTTVSFNSTGNKIKVDVDGYTQAQVDNKLSAKANSADVYTKSATDDKLALKANSADVYNKTTTDNKLALKADTATTYTKTEVNKLVEYVGNASGSIANFDTDLTLPLVDCKATIVASQASGTPTPSTPLPITGYSSANITRCGKNLAEIFDDDTVPSISNGQLVTGGGSRSDYIKVKPSTDYTFSVENSQALYIFFYQADKTWINYQSTTGTTLTKTTPANCAYVMLRLGMDSQTVGQFEEGSTPTAITPYNGNTVTIAFGQTVYGGVLDVMRGKLTVTRAIVDLGDLPWTYNTSFAHPIFYAPLFTKLNNVPNTGVCSCYPILNINVTGAQNAASGLSDDEMALSINTSSYHVFVRDETYTNATELQTALRGQKLVYELATPFDIDLTPVQINALLGVNNVYNDTNGDTEVKYINSNADDTVTVVKNVVGTMPITKHNYSSDEQIVGTWIDGKTVYERTIIGTTTDSTNAEVNKVIFDGAGFVDKYISVDGTLQSGEVGYDNQVLGGYVNATNHVGFYKPSGGSKEVKIYYNSSAYPSGSTYVATIRYTKSSS